MQKREFNFKLVSFPPCYSDKTLDYCRNISQDEWEYENANGFPVRIVESPQLVFIADCFNRIHLSDDRNKRLTMIYPHQWAAA